MDSNDKPSVATVVVSWNSARDIVTCLDSLIRQSHPIKQIIVVDNASTDGTPDLVADQFPAVKLIHRSTNEGFAKGNNIGISVAESEWILTLNPDARLAENFLTRLIEFAASHPRVGSMTGKLLREKQFIQGEPVIDSTGIEIYGSRRVKDRDAGRIDDGTRNNAERVFGACAAAALYRREMLRDVSPDGEVFPESFFSYYEDADLAWRAWRRNWEAWYVPEAVCWHRRGGAPVGSRFSRYLTHRNRLWLIARNEPLYRVLKYPASLICHELLLLLRMLRYPYLFKATLEALIGLPTAIHYRKLLTDVTDEVLPVKSGSGFSVDEISETFIRKNKRFCK